ncbi:MAG: AAA family ATPase [Piscinibacter sp.]
MNPDYQILAPLSEDGRFELLSARRVRTGAAVLLRRLRPQGPAGSAAAELAALQRECGLAGASPGAAALLPRVVDAPLPALLVMEDPGGELLSGRLARGPLPVGTALAVALQVAAALAELHRRGLLHNGLRPAAILCGPDEAQAWLIDFGDAGPPTAPSGPRALALPPARLVYLSPEQTGRLERMPDVRSDLYALGIVLHEMLTGAPPFRSDDPLELIHWHIAGRAQAPAALDPAIPATLSAIVMKLIERAPDDRYQSAAALVQDLTRCSLDWAAQGQIAAFALGRRDLGARIAVPPRLYGRERELHQLLEAFERACLGQAGRSMLLVEGYSGIGKTALIQELVRPIVRRKGYFLSGKFDQVARGVPFGALIQAFRALVRQLLTESEQRLVHWREALSAALGVNGGVLAEVIPEIEYIVGAQPAPVVLGSVEAQNRFQRVLQNFVAAVARPEHPLVLFLDDLQWADAATLALLEPLLTGGDCGCLMLMGAYRDNELEATPRLASTLAALDRAGVALQRLRLGPLAGADLAELVADTLRIGVPQAAPLAELVQRKTGGNPFFVIQFLKLLEREGHLRFDAEAGVWGYRLEEIAGAPLADNVVALMTSSIQRLAPRAQYALTLAACIGSRFDAATLALASEQSPAALVKDLVAAVDDGLLVAVDGAAGETGSYAFLHDRVQQSAYALIPAERREMVHLSVGRLLRARASAETMEAGAFDIVQHLNLGRRLIRDADERRDVAALNLTAGRRAKSATAHDSALELFQAGIELLGDEADEGDGTLAFALRLEAAESRYLCGQFDAALADLAALLERPRPAMARAQVARLRSVAFENMGRYADALASAHEGLALFGLVFPTTASGKAAALEHEIAAIATLRGARDIAALAELPRMDDESMRLQMRMLTDMWSAAYILGDPTLARLISATMVRLSLQHGNVEESAYGYVTHAITVGPVRGEYAAAHAYGLLALEVNRRFDDTRLRAKIHQQFHAHVNLWCQPWRTCLPYAREACRAGLDNGDFLYAAYGAGTEPWAALMATQDLGRFVQDHAPSVALIERLKNPGFADSLRMMLAWARALQRHGAASTSLDDEQFDEAAYLERYRDNPFFASIHAALRVPLCVLLGTPQQALQAARHSAALIHHVPGTVWPVLHDFWHALALGASVEREHDEGGAEALASLREAQRGFEARAAHCAENFGTQALLLAAEIARIEGRLPEAIELAEQAIEFAASRPLLALEALAHEIAVRLRLRHHQPRLAELHLAQARERYARWGALAKLQALSAEHGPQGGPGEPGQAVAVGDPVEIVRRDDWRGAAVDGLDLVSVLKASQAIAEQVDLDTLLARLMRIAIENAGAERGALVLESEAGPVVHADDSTEASDAESGVALDASRSVPAGLVHFVRRTGETLRLGQDEIDEQHGGEPYLHEHRPRALMCLPLRKRGRSIGVLYLEHRRAGDVFTLARQRTLEMLATQAAVSIENARLVSGLRREVVQRLQTQNELAQALTEVRRLKDDLEAENTHLRRDLIANVSHDLRTPLVAMRGYLEVLASRGDALTAGQRAQYLSVAVRQSEHLATLIDELFELARLDFKGIALAREPFPFDELAADVLQKFQLAAERQQVTLQIEAPQRLPFVEADLSLMERVLENLIGNALKHTPPDGRIVVEVCSDGERLVVRVVDSGRGIPAAQLPFVFDRFYRGETGPRGGAGGAGLGLAIARRIVELHGGSIGVESDGASGTSFHFCLPLREAAPGGLQSGR